MYDESITNLSVFAQSSGSSSMIQLQKALLYKRSMVSVIPTEANSIL